jgi:hypothetical protein
MVLSTLENILSRAYSNPVRMQVLATYQESPYFEDLVHDTFAFAVNTGNEQLEEMVYTAYPDIIDRRRVWEELWIYSQVYASPEVALDSPPWGEYLAIAIIEDLPDEAEDIIATQEVSEEDLVRALVAAYQTGEEHLIGLLARLLGPDLANTIEAGLIDVDLRSARMPYYRLFPEKDLARV